MNSECFVPLIVCLRLRSLRNWPQSGITLPLARDDMRIERKEKTNWTVYTGMAWSVRGLFMEIGVPGVGLLDSWEVHQGPR